MTATLIIDGNAITDIPSFFAEINRVFMAEESWTLGESLDALDDLLRGGYGALRDQDTIALAWTNIEASRAALGEATTRAWLLGKLEIAAFNAAEVQRQLDALEAGTGPTYFDIIMEIIASHPRVQLVA